MASSRLETWPFDPIGCLRTSAVSAVPIKRPYPRSPTRREHGRRSCEHTLVVCLDSARHLESMEERMNRNKTIDYVEFHAEDLPAVKQFYSHVFGWEFVDYGPDYTSFKDGRTAGGFARGSVPPGSGPLIVIFVEDLASTQEQIKDAGGKITKEIFSFPGGSRFHFADPGGNELAAWTED
jgi:uncharacterized protein